MSCSPEYWNFGDYGSEDLIHAAINRLYLRRRTAGRAEDLDSYARGLVPGRTSRDPVGQSHSTQT
jgi:hypothetical protein